MFCRLSLAATTVAALAVGIQPASAIYVGNALSTNALSTNALSTNGISSNPVTLNGVNASAVDLTARGEPQRLASPTDGRVIAIEWTEPPRAQ